MLRSVSGRWIALAIVTTATVSTAPIGTRIATKTYGSDEHQVVVPFELSRSDTFTIAANGTAVDCTVIPCSRFALQVKGTGAAPTAWNVVLEVSLDGTNYTALLTHTNADLDPDGAVKLLAAAAPVKYFRSRCVSITLGGATNVVATILGQAA